MKSRMDQALKIILKQMLSQTSVIIYSPLPHTSCCSFSCGTQISKHQQGQSEHHKCTKQEVYVITLCKEQTEM